MVVDDRAASIRFLLWPFLGTVTFSRRSVIDKGGIPASGISLNVTWVSIYCGSIWRHFLGDADGASPFEGDVLGTSASFDARMFGEASPASSIEICRELNL